MMKKEMEFEFNKDLKVGHMRVDYIDRKPHSQWFPTNLFDELNKADKEDCHGFSSFMTKMIPDFNTLVDNYCEGNEGYDNEYNYFRVLDNLNVWIRLNPVESDYAMYINFYKKDLTN